MSRSRILADYVSSGDELALKAPLASPTFTGTTNVSSGVTLPSNPTVTLGSNCTFPAGHIKQVSYWTGTGSQYTTTSNVPITNGYWDGSTYPNITVTSGNYIYALLEWRYNIYGGSNDSQGTYWVYDVTNTTVRGQDNNAYTAHTANESSGIWNYQGCSTTCIAMWTDSSGASVQVSGQMTASSGGTNVFYGDYCHMTLMEVQA